MTDDLALKMLKKFGHSASVMCHWFINRVERQHPEAAEELAETKKNLAELDRLLKELDNEISL